MEMAWNSQLQFQLPQLPQQVSAQSTAEPIILLRRIFFRCSHPTAINVLSHFSNTIIFQYPLHCFYGFLFRRAGMNPRTQGNGLKIPWRLKMSKGLTQTEPKLKMHNLSNNNYGAFIQCLVNHQFYKTCVELPQDGIISHPATSTSTQFHIHR